MMPTNRSKPALRRQAMLVKEDATVIERILTIMADEKTSGIYGKPNFGLILGLLVVAIVLLLIGGWVVLHFDLLHMRTPRPATGMTLLYELR